MKAAVCKMWVLEVAALGWVCAGPAAQWWSSIALRENRSQSGAGQPVLPAGPSSCSSFLLLSHHFFSSLLFFSPPLFFLIFSALLFCPDKTVAFSMTVKIMRSEGWTVTSECAILRTTWTKWKNSVDFALSPPCGCCWWETKTLLSP